GAATMPTTSGDTRVLIVRRDLLSRSSQASGTLATLAFLSQSWQYLLTSLTISGSELFLAVSIRNNASCLLCAKHIERTSCSFTPGFRLPRSHLRQEFTPLVPEYRAREFPDSLPSFASTKASDASSWTPHWWADERLSPPKANQ